MTLRAQMRTLIEEDGHGAWSGLGAVDVLALLDRITRLEAQTGIRGRAVVMYRERARKAEAGRDQERKWRLDLDAAHDEEIENAERAEARIQAVRDVHASDDHGAGCGKPGCFPSCLGCDEEYPCPTIRTLEGSVTSPEL